jgi:hypothetical protein
MVYTIQQYPALPHVITPRQPGARTISLLVLHATAGRRTGDLKALSGRERGHLVSCHYYITKTGEIIQLVQDKDIAWHAGVSAWQGKMDCNEPSIGVEMENLNDGSDPYPQVQIDAALWLVRSKVQQYTIVKSRLVRHAEVALPLGRKDDPRGFPWASFVQQVYGPTPATGPGLYVVRLNDTSVREGPGVSFPIALGGTRELYAGAVVEIDSVTPGQRLTRMVEGQSITSSQWGHLANHEGFVWLPLLMPAQAVWV